MKPILTLVRIPKTNDCKPPGFELLRNLRISSWQEFERVVAEVFRRRGYSLIEQDGNQPNGDIDLILRKDGEVILVQCRHWQFHQVDLAIIREQFGILSASKASRVFVLTAGSFTEDAIAFAAGKPMQLIDGPKLFELLLELLGKPQNSGQKLPAKAISDASISKEPGND